MSNIHNLNFFPTYVGTFKRFSVSGRMKLKQEAFVSELITSSLEHVCNIN